MSFWPTSDYELEPGFTFENYVDDLRRLRATSPSRASRSRPTGRRCASALVIWAVTLVLGFAIAYFLAFHVRSTGTQTLLFVVCTIPFWTSNVIRMISWLPLLGRNGLVNQALLGSGWSTSRSSGCCSPTSRWCWPSCTSTRCS